jgi:G:T-mismatch repair DNA endonuclease (very short patch repair protein)
LADVSPAGHSFLAGGCAGHRSFAGRVEFWTKRITFNVDDEERDLDFVKSES